MTSLSLVVSVEHGQPHCRFIGRRPFDPMLSMDRDVDVIARPHFDGLIVAVKKQFCSTFQNDHPLVLVLIVPVPFGTGLPGRNDPFDADVVVLGEDFDEFLGQIRRQVGEEIVHGYFLDSNLQATSFPANTATSFLP